MVTKKRKVVWDIEAKNELKSVCAYIRKASPQGADKVKKAVFAKIDKLTKTPEMYEADKLRTDGDKRFRAFIAYSYRVTYYIDSEHVFILRVRHTSMEPLEY